MTDILPQEAIRLDFHRENTVRGPHGLHAFAAKLPPQLPRWGIERYSRPGDLVCDPMAGSGTTLVEALALGRRALGCDLDPLACLIASAKTTPVDAADLAAANAALRAWLDADRDRLGRRKHRSAAWRRLELPDKERWFCARVAADLCAIKHAIGSVDASPEVRRLWQALFSSLITAKHSVASVRDLVHSRHHRHEHAAPPDAMARFARRLADAERRMARHAALAGADAATILFGQVARVARRGRKRFLGLTFVTQLPQHLPEEVLGLLNNFILHKISDDAVVGRLKRIIGGIYDSLWDRLPGLAPGQAILAATSLARPLLVSVNPTPCRLRMTE